MNAAVATLEVVPVAATVPVGGVAQYSAIARDASGQMVATPMLEWLSGTPAVGTVTPAGAATGASVGQTTITASSGNVTSAPAVLNVIEAGACDGIASIGQFDARVSFDYSDYIVTPVGATVVATHSAYVSATLLPAPSVFGKLEWVGALVGTDPPGHVPGANAYIDESLEDYASDPTEVITVKGVGQPLPTPGVDGMRLEVDLSTCTFQFYVTPSVHTTQTNTEHAVLLLPGPNEGTHTYSQDTPLGILQKGVTPLGNWRTLTLGDYPQPYLIFPSVSIAGIPVSGDAYVPSGVLPQAAFFDPANPLPRSASFGGATLVNYFIAAHGQ
ncbi:MAG: hypothetical protein ABI641_00245 [Caldimonas sp.]